MNEGFHARMNGEPIDRHNPEAVLKDRNGECRQDDAESAAGRAKEDVAHQEASDKEGQAGTNTAALLGNLDIEARQRKPKSIPKNWNAAQPEENPRRLSRANPQNESRSFEDGLGERDR